MIKRVLFVIMALLLTLCSVSCRLDGKPVDGGNAPVPTVNATEEPVPQEPQYESLYNDFMAAERYYVRYQQTVFGFTTTIEMAVDGDKIETYQTSDGNKLHTLTLNGIKYTINDDAKAYTQTTVESGAGEETGETPDDGADSDDVTYKGSGSANINGVDCVYDEYSYIEGSYECIIRYYIHKAENRLYAMVTSISDFQTTMLIEEYRVDYTPEGWFVLPEDYEQLTQEEFDALYAE